MEKECALGSESSRDVEICACLFSSSPLDGVALYLLRGKSIFTFPVPPGRPELPLAWIRWGLGREWESIESYLNFCRVCNKYSEPPVTQSFLNITPILFLSMNLRLCQHLLSLIFLSKIESQVRKYKLPDRGKWSTATRSGIAQAWPIPRSPEGNMVDVGKCRIWRMQARISCASPHILST